MPSEYRPRLSVDLTEEQFNRKQRLMSIVHGLQKEIFSIILDDLLDLIEEKGPIVMGLILQKKIKPREVIDCMKEE